MRILLPILQFPPDVNSNGRLLAQVGEGLAQRGHQVSVLTTFPHYARFRVWDEYRGKLAQRATYRGMDVLRLYVHARGKKERPLDRFLSYFSFSLLATVAGLCSTRSFDVILCPNGGFLTGVAAAIVSQVRRIPLVLNVQDLYPETPISMGQVRNRWVISILRALERYMYVSADHISVITPAFQQHIVRRGVPPSRVSVVPNFVDTDFIRPLPRDNAFSREHGLTEKFVITHAGNVGLAYDLDTLLDAASLLSEHAQIVVLIVGDGVVKARLEERARRLELSNVRFLPFQPMDRLPLLRAASDVQVALTRAGASAHSMPSKVYEIMASGRPVLASADRGSDLWRLVHDTACGRCVEPQDASRLAEAVLGLYSDSEACQSMGQRGRRTAEACYSRRVVVDAYEQLLSGVVDSHDQIKRSRRLVFTGLHD